MSVSAASIMTIDLFCNVPLANAPKLRKCSATFLNNTFNRGTRHNMSSICTFSTQTREDKDVIKYVILCLEHQ